MKTLILIFHPYFKQSRANRALADAAKQIPGTEVFDVQAAYPDGKIDGDAEVARLLAADRIVYQFPIQWYAAPPILQAWQNAVLTRMYYINYEKEGRRLEGTPLLIATTVGNTPAAYTPEGVNLMPVSALLNPLRSMANRCGLPLSEPFVVYETMKADDETLQKAGAAYASWLSRTSITHPKLIEHASSRFYNKE